MRIVVPFGTRPEIIKLAPVVAELVRRGHQVRRVATGQHDAPAMSEQFHEELGLQPDVTFTLPAAAHARLGSLLAQAAALLDDEASQGADLVLLLGDTFTVPVFALAARRAGLPVAHIEAGLRSLNPRSMEEVDRRMGAACTSLHLAPTALAARFLAAEGVDPERVRVVGNPVIDALRLLGVERRPVDQRRGVLVTAHRATNVDDPDRLRALVDLVTTLGTTMGPVSFPVHPRTADRLRTARLDRVLAAAPGVELTDPLPYRELLDVLAASRVVVTDSGGIQEEASWLGVPAVVLRRSTPRWEGVMAGAAILTGVDAVAAVAATTELASPARQQAVADLPCPYGDGHTAERIADVLDDERTPGLLALDEPDFRGTLPAQVADALRGDGAVDPRPAPWDAGTDPVAGAPGQPAPDPGADPMSDAGARRRIEPQHRVK